MKKYLLLILCMAVIASGTFAIEVGGGLLFDKKTRSRTESMSYSSSEVRGWYEGTFNDTYRDFGLYGFAGWKYLDFNIGLSFRKHIFEASYYYPNTVPDDERERDGSNYSALYVPMRIGINFKYPFIAAYFLRICPTIGSSFFLFYDDYPIDLHVGLEVDVLFARNMYVFTKGEFNSSSYFWAPGFLFNLGAGWMLERKRR